jgi:hypothetical protein
MGCAAWRERQAEATPAAPKCLAFVFLNVHWQMADVVTARDNFLECRKLLTASDPVELGASIPGFSFSAIETLKHAYCTNSACSRYDKASH